MTRVLVVDDEIDTLNLLHTILEISGYQAFTTLNSIDAITLAEVEHPDCILLDIMMPQLDGFTLCKMMRMHPTTKNLPIVFVTAYSALDLEDRRIDAGADMVLPKPIGMDALIEAIEKAKTIRTPKVPDSPVPAPSPTLAANTKVTQPLQPLPVSPTPVATPAPIPSPLPSAPITPVVPAMPVPAIPAAQPAQSMPAMVPAVSNEPSIEIKPDPAPTPAPAPTTQTSPVIPVTPATLPPKEENTSTADSSNTGDTKRATEPSGVTAPTPAPTQPETKKP